MFTVGVGAKSLIFLVFFSSLDFGFPKVFLSREGLHLAAESVVTVCYNITLLVWWYGIEEGKCSIIF